MPNATIQYTGKVTISLKRKDTVVSTYTYHNTGTDWLFKFLCYCVKGDYRTAEAIRPFKVKLFYNRQQHPTNSAPVINECDPATNFISTNKPVTIKTVGNKTTATLHFLVPFANIFTLISSINQVCLYGTGEVNNENYMAYYYFIDQNDPNSWKPITISKANRTNYSLIIEWEMSFDNATIE